MYCLCRTVKARKRAARQGHVTQPAGHLLDEWWVVRHRGRESLTEPNGSERLTLKADIQIRRTFRSSSGSHPATGSVKGFWRCVRTVWRSRKECSTEPGGRCRSKDRVQRLLICSDVEGNRRCAGD